MNRYAMMGDIYAKAGQMTEASKYRRMPSIKSLTGFEAQCTIELDGKIVQIATHESKHPLSKQMLEDSIALGKRAKEAGYKFNTRVAKKWYASEEEKERELCGHCERLTLALALRHMPADKQIRFVKNMRACEDCHSFAKFAAKMLQREFQIRDRKMWHHYRKSTLLVFTLFFCCSGFDCVLLQMERAPATTSIENANEHQSNSLNSGCEPSASARIVHVHEIDSERQRN